MKGDYHLETEIQKIPMSDPVGHGNPVHLTHDGISGVLPFLYQGIYDGKRQHAQL